MVEGFKATPMWPGLTRLAHTIPYDVEVTGPGNVLPAGRLGAIRVPTLVMAGTAGSDWMLPGARALVAAIPGARLAALEGMDHGAPGSHPEVLLAVLREFLGQP
jgi:pimeloyl-ACP methyl ester carboxylesterase